MGFDENTFWYPRVGTTGIQLYGIPGGTQLDNSVDGGNPSPMLVGDSSIYSATPLLSEIIYDASSNPLALGLNQAIAMTRRRIALYNTAFGTAMTLPTYVTGTRILASHITALRTSIAAIRAAEGLTAYTFSTLATNTIRLGKMLSELRQALRISGVLKFTFSGGIIPGKATANTYQRGFSAYPATTPPFTQGIVAGSNINGQKNYGGPPVGTIATVRQLWSFPIPSYVNSSPTSVMKMTTPVLGPFLVTAANGGENFNIAVFLSNTDDHIQTVVNANNLNNACGSFLAAPSTLYTFPINAAALAARSGSFASFIIGNALEMANGGANNKTSLLFINSSATLELDFGV